MELTSEPVLYGNEVIGLGHLVCINILACAAIHQHRSNKPHIVICKRNDFSDMRHIIEILSPNICFVPVCEKRYSRIMLRKESRLYSFEYFSPRVLPETAVRPLYGAHWNTGLEYLGGKGITLYNEHFLRVPRLSELYPDIFQPSDKIAVINARTTPTDTYNRNSDPAKLQPLISLLKRKGYRVVRIGANFASARLNGIDLDMSDKWKSGIELSSLKSASIVIGSLTGITILSGMLEVPTIVYDCPTPIQTYLFHNFPNHYILFKKPPIYARRDVANIYDYFSTAQTEYIMLGAIGNSGSEGLGSTSMFHELIPNTASELCEAVEYVLRTIGPESVELTKGMKDFEDCVYRCTGLKSSHNRLFPENIYRG